VGAGHDADTGAATGAFLPTEGGAPATTPEAVYRLLLDESSDPIFLFREDGQYVYVNRAFADGVGRQAADIIGKRIWDVFPHDEADKRFAAVRWVFAHAETKAIEVRVPRPDGDRHYLTTVKPVFGDAGAVTMVLCISKDITDRILAERETRERSARLAESEERYRSLVELAPIGIAVHEGGVIRYANPAAIALVGARALSDVVGRPLLDLVHPDDRAAVRARVSSAVADGEVMPNREERFLRLDGAEIDVEAQGTEVPYEGRRAVQVIFRDITERKRADATEAALRGQLFESQKMEAIGTLAGGIAHELNNVLAMIAGNVALARRDAKAAPPVLESLGEIDKAAIRARGLVQQILTFSRRQSQELAVQPLGPIVVEALRLLRATLPATVTIATVIEDGGLCARANANQLEQVLMNLCTNAWHALGGRPGRLEVGLERADAPGARTLRLGRIDAGPYARIWVRDSGAGMDEATQARMFEPFFTTKPQGQGTGLGLAVVHGIVVGHDGAIDVASAPGAGTTVAVWLPLRAAPSAPPRGASVAPEAEGAGRRVLYVDDEDSMVLLVRRLLDRLGYRTEGASSVDDALERLRAEPGAFDVLVTDYNMPVRTGLDLAVAARTLAPDLPVLITSGYVTDALRAEAARVGVAQVVDKELSVDALCEAIDAIVRKRRG
jgi:PAS domain S-box-containing protein